MEHLIRPCIYPISEKTTRFNFVEQNEILNFLNQHFEPWVAIFDENFKVFAPELFRKIPRAQIITIPAGEIYKNYQTKMMIESELFKNNYGRNATLVAIGGGVVCDLVAFVAATYLRGVDLVFIPTTFLCMIDASIGGKAGINTPFGKNLIGCFYPAKNILISSDFMRSWTLNHLLEGIAEVIKTALVLDQKFFFELTRLASQIRERTTLDSIIKKTILLKSSVVSADFYDRGERTLLNFGHTIAHALESCYDYKIPHGIAVAAGMAVEGAISHLEGYLSRSDFTLINKTLESFGFDLTLCNEIDRETFYQKMMQDKKTHSGAIHFVILDSIGKACSFGGRYSKPVSSKVIDCALDLIKKGCYENLPG